MNQTQAQEKENKPDFATTKTKCTLNPKARPDLRTKTLQKVINPREVIKATINEFLAQSKFVQGLSELDMLINKTTGTLAALIENGQPDEMLTEKEVAERYNILSVSQLKMMRHQERGPIYHKLGKARTDRVYYRVGDLEKWLADGKVMPYKH